MAETEERFDFSFKVEFRNSTLQNVQQFLDAVAELAAKYGAETGSVMDVKDVKSTYPKAE